MEFNYLKEIRNIYENCQSLLEIIFVLGNTSCDLDSALSAYILSISENLKCGTIKISEKGKPSINEKITKVYLPVLNIKRGTLHYRIDIKYIFDKFNIDQNDFWYISDSIFDANSLFKYKNYENKNIKTSLILVDHTILTKDQQYLADYVIDIHDHHLLTNLPDLYKNLKRINIKYPIGSCTTLILNDYLCIKKKETFPSKILPPLLAVSAILVDTEKFKDNLYGIRWVDLDKKVYKYLKKLVKKKEDIKMKEYYKEIKEIKHDEEKNLELGVEALLSKDQKIFDWGQKKAIWSSFPVSFYKIKKKFGDEDINNNFMKYYSGKSEDEIKNTFYLTNSSIEKGKKLFTIFNPIQLPFTKEEIEKEIKKYNEKDEMSVEIEKTKGEMCNIILPGTYSRKIFEPILKGFFNNIK